MIMLIRTRSSKVIANDSESKSLSRNDATLFHSQFVESFAEENDFLKWTEMITIKRRNFIRTNEQDIGP